MSERYDSATPQLLAFLGAESTQIPMKIIPLSERGREGGKGVERQTDRQTDRQTESETERRRQREREGNTCLEYIYAWPRYTKLIVPKVGIA